MGSFSRCLSVLPIGVILIALLSTATSAANSSWDRFNQLGTNAYRDGALADAEDYFKSALEAAQTSHDPHLATALTNLGAVYRDEQKFDQSESCFKRAIQIKESTLGNLDPSLASTLQHYSDLLRQMHRVPEARQLEARADGIVTIYRNQQGSPFKGKAFTDSWRMPSSGSILEEQAAHDARMAAEDARIAAESAERARIQQQQQMREDEQAAMENPVPVAYTDNGAGGIPSGYGGGYGQTTIPGSQPHFGRSGVGHSPGAAIYSNNPAGMMPVPSLSGGFTPQCTGSVHPIMCGRATSFTRR